MYDFLLAAHLLSAAAMITAMVIFSAYELKAPVSQRQIGFAEVMVQVGAMLLLVFGVWLALYVDGYELWDGWILASIVLWAAMAGIGARVGKTRADQIEAGAVATGGRVAVMHWFTIAAAFVILVLMIWKPGA
jgi:hypothetical protein